MKRVANSPRATPAQIERLAKKDLRAALSHPNAPLSFLLQHPDRWTLIAASPAWALHSLESPEVTTKFITDARIYIANGEIQRLSSELRRTDAERRRLVAWTVEVAGTVVPGWRRHVLDHPCPSHQRRTALRWLIGLEAEATRFMGLNDFPAIPYLAAALNAIQGCLATAVYASQYRVIEGRSTPQAKYALDSMVNYARGTATHVQSTIADPVARMTEAERQAMRLKDFFCGRVLWIEKVIARLARESKQQRGAR